MKLGLNQLCFPISISALFSKQTSKNGCLVQVPLYSSSLSSESLIQVKPCGFFQASSSAIQYVAPFCANKSCVVAGAVLQVD